MAASDWGESRRRCRTRPRHLDSGAAGESADEHPDDDGAISDNDAAPFGEDQSADAFAGAFVSDGDDHTDSAENESPGADADLDHEAERRTRRFTPWVLGAFAGVVLLATVITTLGVTLSGPDNPSPSLRQHAVKSGPAPTMAAAPAPTPADGGDHPLPFTASADCPAGASTSAKSIADPDKPSPWICVRHTDGQPLYITLGPAGIERAYVITAVSIVPGILLRPRGPAVTHGYSIGWSRCCSGSSMTLRTRSSTRTPAMLTAKRSN